ncbi:hypothetical protein WDV93_02280 [Pantoea ananatis]
MGFTLYVHNVLTKCLKMHAMVTVSVMCYAAGDVITGVFGGPDLGGGVIKSALLFTKASVAACERSSSSDKAPT